MDLSLKSILFILFIVTPGILFRRFYYRGEFSKQFYSKDWVFSLTASAFIGAIIQITSYYTFKSLIFSLESFKAVKGVPNTTEIVELFTAISEFNIDSIDSKSDTLLICLCYLLVVYLLSYVLAIIAFNFVRILKLDRSSKIFRYSNYWHYYFKGEIKDFTEFTGIKKTKVLYTIADVLIQTSSGNTEMYSGVLTQYTIEAKTNKLENLYLTNPKRWKECPDENKRKPFDIKSNCLIIDNKNVLNINLNYVQAEDKFIKTDFIESVVLILMLVYTVFVIVSDHHWLISSRNWIYTVLIKLYYFIVGTMFFSLTTLLLDVLLLIVKRYNYSSNLSPEDKALERNNLLRSKIKTTAQTIIYLAVWYGIFRFFY